jgi:cyclophilin family peptidyl-prolyl cis-trans isomerase
MQPRTCVVLTLFLLAVAVLPGCGSDSTAPQASAQDAATDTNKTGSSGATLKAPKRPESDPLHPRVTIETTQGAITLELDAEHSPGTVYNFINYVNSSHYDNTLFHYVDPGKMILGGSFTPSNERKPEGAPIRNEAHNGLKNTRGTISMSRHFEAIDSATCQFFINVSDNLDLDHKADTADEYGYCVFGKVVRGMDVVDKIAGAPVHDAGELVSTPQQQVVIQQVKTLR